MATLITSLRFGQRKIGGNIRGINGYGTSDLMVGFVEESGYGTKEVTGNFAGGGIDSMSGQGRAGEYPRYTHSYFSEAGETITAGGCSDRILLELHCDSVGYNYNLSGNYTPNCEGLMRCVGATGQWTVVGGEQEPYSPEDWHWEEVENGTEQDMDFGINNYTTWDLVCVDGIPEPPL